MISCAKSHQVAECKENVIAITTSSATSSTTQVQRSLSRVLGILALSLALFVVATDLFLGHVLGLGDNIILQPDPGASYVFKPNQHVHRFFRDTEINQYSMRSPAFSLAKAPGVYRVMLVGDSMTYGSTQIDQRAIFSSLLAAELPAQLHQPVEVLNASASAWAIANEAGYLESHGTYNSDLVVLVLNTGDSLQPPSTLADVGGDAAAVRSPCALCELWTRYLRDRILHLDSKTDAGTAPTADEMQNAGPNLQRLIHFYQLTHQHHVRMAIVFLAMRQYIPANAHASAPGKLVDWAHANHVPLIDATAAESPYSLKQLTLDGIHFNAFGHRVIATDLEQHWDNLDPSRIILRSTQPAQ